MTQSELLKAVSAGPVRVVGRGTHDRWAYPSQCANTVTIGGGVVAFSAADGFITVGAGMLVPELREALAEGGQMIPILEAFASPALGRGWIRGSLDDQEDGGGESQPPSPRSSGLPPFKEEERSGQPPHPNPLALGSEGEGAGTIGGLISMAFPHPAEAHYFDWRTWVLGMKIMLADGTVVKSGTTAVKSVAGFDVHKLLVGARGTLGIILEVTLRTTGRKSLTFQMREENPGEVNWIQRVLPADLLPHVESNRDKIVAWDPGTATVWARETLPRRDGDWALTIRPEAIFRIRNDEPEYWLQRLKAQLDPENKLNPGGLGDLM